MAQELLVARLAIYGYTQSKLTTGFWMHKTRSIQFCLMVDGFGVKNIETEHAINLKNLLEENYTIFIDGGGSKYVGLIINWDYNQQEVHLLMPTYVQ